MYFSHVRDILIYNISNLRLLISVTGILMNSESYKMNFTREISITVLEIVRPRQWLPPQKRPRFE